MSLVAGTLVDLSLANKKKWKMQDNELWTTKAASLPSDMVKRPQTKAVRCHLVVCLSQARKAGMPGEKVASVEVRSASGFSSSSKQSSNEHGISLPLHRYSKYDELGQLNPGTESPEAQDGHRPSKPAGLVPLP